MLNKSIDVKGRTATFYGKDTSSENPKALIKAYLGFSAGRGYFAVAGPVEENEYGSFSMDLFDPREVRSKTVKERFSAARFATLASLLDKATPAIAEAISKDDKVMAKALLEGIYEFR